MRKFAQIFVVFSEKLKKIDQSTLGLTRFNKGLVTSASPSRSNEEYIRLAVMISGNGLSSASSESMIPSPFLSTT